MPYFYLNSYVPLAASRVGRAAAIRYKIDPLVDGSIRREPDLEHKHPSISCLCRAGLFTPRLAVGDVVAYVLRKGSYGFQAKQRRLTSVLQVTAVFQSHANAAEWYIERNLPLPSNCLVPGNKPKPFAQSHRRMRASKFGCAASSCHNWDKGYKARAAKHGTFVVCRRLFRELTWEAPMVPDAVLTRVFGKIPGTRNPGRWSLRHGQRLLKALDLGVQIE